MPEKLKKTPSMLRDQFKGWSVSELKNAIWMVKSNANVARGGYPLEWYEEELYLRTGCRKGYHE